MRITILTYGWRGDVQLFLPLSLGLMANGHSVKLAAPARFKDLIKGHNIKFVGQKLRNEDGVGEAVQLIEKYSNDFYRHYS